MTPARPGDPLTWPVAGLLREAPGTSRVYPVAGVTIDVGEELQLADPIEGTVRLTRTNRGLLVRARLTTALATQCSRCLRDIEVPLELAIDEEALPSIDLETGAPVNSSAEPDVLRLTAKHQLDLEPSVLEAIQLAEPIAPLCREDCPGLCEVCGEDLSEHPHEHETEIDPRLEALRAFTVDGEVRTH